jgi:integrase
MASLVSISPITHPRVTHVATWYQGHQPGTDRLKRHRKYFKSEAKAKAFKRKKEVELQRDSRHETPATAQELAAIHTARRTIGSHRLIEAIQLLQRQDIERGTGLTVEILVAKRIEAAELGKRSSRHIGDLKTRLGAFRDHFEGRLISEVNTEAIEEWMHLLPGVEDSTKVIYRQRIVALFTWAMKRGLAASNPAKGVTILTVDKSPPGILTPEEAAHFLASAPGRILPALTIGLFAGLRRSEVERLHWSHIHLERGFIEVIGKRTRRGTASRRLVTIEPALQAWLARFPGHTGKVVRGTYHFMWRDYMATRPLGRDWPQNALRHSFASYHLALYQDAAATALQMGHTTTKVLFEHYRELVTKEQAAKFWALRPADTSPILPYQRKPPGRKKRTPTTA